MQADEQFIRACLNGQATAYRHLVERYQSRLNRYLSARLGNADATAEAVQETFVRAYFALGDLRKPASFFSWLLGIADRVAKETHRAAGRQRNVDCKQLEPLTSVDCEDASVGTTVKTAVSKLPEIYREVVMLRFYGGQSCQEISRDLDVPLGTVTKRLSRAYALLRERLGPEFPHRESEAS